MVNGHLTQLCRACQGPQQGLCRPCKTRRTRAKLVGTAVNFISMCAHSAVLLRMVTCKAHRTPEFLRIQVLLIPINITDLEKLLTRAWHPNIIFVKRRWKVFDHLPIKDNLVENFCHCCTHELMGRNTLVLIAAAATACRLAGLDHDSLLIRSPVPRSVIKSNLSGSFIASRGQPGETQAGLWWFCCAGWVESQPSVGGFTTHGWG